LFIILVCCYKNAAPSDTIANSKKSLSDFYDAINQQEEAAEEPSFIKDYEVPDWVKRTNVAVKAGSDIKPTYFIETVQPLLGTQNKETVIFTQARASGRDYRNIYNLGLGARRVFQDSYLLGANIFYDYQDYHQHHRAGVGFEAITDHGLEGRLNNYIKVSNIRTIEENAGGLNYEEVANGCDWEIGGPLPYIQPLKLYGGGYWYAFEKFPNKYGWKMRAEYDPVKYTRFVFEMFDDNKRNDVGYRFEGALTLALTSFHPMDILNDLKDTKEAFPKIDLKEKILNRVVRDFDITVISSTQTKTGLTVEAGRT